MIILQVIGSILLILLAILSLILFLPNRYDIYIEKWEKFFLKVHFLLLNFIKINFEIVDKETLLEVFIFTKKVYPFKRKVKINNKTSQKTKTETSSKRTQNKALKNTKQKPDLSSVIKPIKATYEFDKLEEKEGEEFVFDEEFEKNIDFSLLEEFQVIFNYDLTKEFEEEFDANFKIVFDEKIEQEQQKFDFKQIVSIIKNSEYRNKAVNKLFYTIKRMIKTIAPKKFQFDLEIGTNSPATTGQIIGLCSIFYPYYIQYGTINGNFESNAILGEIFIAGKFNIATILKILIDLLLYKPCRIFVKEILDSKN
ncbi:hypothetical protein AN641_07470 [Candidatus Epulonipiscioides gigas]|nr:hypothetical protein AN641_07470 [Epulopiscium sp. SCG-C07WGA-EpuloA2]